MDTNCREINETAKNLFVVDENGCEYEYEDRKWNNNMCIPPNNITDTNEHFPRDYSLYSHYGASGPFLNSNARPITTSMKCSKLPGILPLLLIDFGRKCNVYGSLTHNICMPCITQYVGQSMMAYFQLTLHTIHQGL